MSNEHMVMITVTAVEGQTFKVDTSDEACGRFRVLDDEKGLKSGDEIVSTCFGSCTVVGVAPSIRKGTSGSDILWITRKSLGNKVKFLNDRDLRNYSRM